MSNQKPVYFLGLCFYGTKDIYWELSISFDFGDNLVLTKKLFFKLKHELALYDITGKTKSERDNAFHSIAENHKSLAHEVAQAIYVKLLTKIFAYAILTLDGTKRNTSVLDDDYIIKGGAK